MSTTIKLIVGLGNPGSQYAATRHNAGAWLVERFARRFGFSLAPESRFWGLTGRATVAQHDVRFLIPTTFMNKSGQSIQAMAHFYKIKPTEILIAHDELALPPGIIKFKQGGGHAGHNGLRDTIAKLGNCQDFVRLRVGIGHPGHKSQVSGFVLGKPPSGELSQIDEALDEAERCIELMFEQGLAKATTRLNSFKPN